MHNSSRIFAGVTVAAALVLTGCTGEDDSTDIPSEASSPTPTVDPTQRAQDEAFGAIKAFHRASDSVSHDGWEDMSPIDSVARGEVTEEERYWGSKHKDEGRFSTGETKLSDFTATDVDVEKKVEATVCVDTTKLILHNSDGSDVKLSPQIPLKAVKRHTAEYDDVQDKWLVVEYDSAGAEPC